MNKALSRRKVVLGGGALAGGAAIIVSKPTDKSGARNAYFEDMQTALKNAGIATPTLVIDKARLNQNIDTLVSTIPDGMGYRVVSKSLPSPKLIDHICKRAKTNRLMTFNLQMLDQFAVDMPETTQLLGKPLPVAAFETFLKTRSPENVECLIDTPKRLAQYAALAKAAGAKLKVNLELDVGLHRGGYIDGDDLGETLAAIKSDPHLSFSGFMGYEPHVSKMPTSLGFRKRSLSAAWDVYRSCLARAADVFSESEIRSLTRNAAGSPTYKLYKDTDIANEVSVGSALVKPTDFDTDLLEDHVPAVFIATPVIKLVQGTTIPGLEVLKGWSRFWNPNLDKTVFIYGGHWLAKPIDPPGLSYNKIFGRSSNQEMLNAGPSLSIQPDDFVFLRPTQSEALFLQFGDIALYEAGEITEFWPVLKTSA